MIVRNEAHVVRDVIDAVSPYISSWVIVDTGSEDGTQDVIREHMKGLGLPGELYERPWRNFGFNRTEALNLAQGHADYIWVMDADDLLVGTADLSDLDADAYLIRIESPGVAYWRRQIFRNGVPWRYEGVVHEYTVCDVPVIEKRIEGDFAIQSRRIGGRNLDPLKYLRDAELLLAEVERNPEDARSVFYLARSYNCLYDWPNARKWYARRAEMGGWEEEVFFSLWRLATSMAMLGEPWPEVQDAYLRAWEYRPRRAEPLLDLAIHYRKDRRYALGYLFAQFAARIPLPVEDDLFVNREVYHFRAADEQAVCASWTGRHAEALELWRWILAHVSLPRADSRRIQRNRNFMARALLEPATVYPAGLMASLTAGGVSAALTVTITAGPEVAVTERTLNSFLNCCLDLPKDSRFLIVDSGLSESGRSRLAQLYPFAEITQSPREDGRVASIRKEIGGRLWLHLGAGWQFFARENYISILTAVLDTESSVFAVGLNLNDDEDLIDPEPDETELQDADLEHADYETGEYHPMLSPELNRVRYVLTDAVPTGPAMYDVARADKYWAGEASPHAATLEEVLCVRCSRL